MSDTEYDNNDFQPSVYRALRAEQDHEYDRVAAHDARARIEREWGARSAAMEGGVCKKREGDRAVVRVVVNGVGALELRGDMPVQELRVLFSGAAGFSVRTQTDALAGTEAETLLVCTSNCESVTLGALGRRSRAPLVVTQIARARRRVRRRREQIVVIDGEDIVIASEYSDTTSESETEHSRARYEAVANNRKRAR